MLSRKAHRHRLAAMLILPLGVGACVEVTETAGGSGGNFPSDLGGNECAYYQDGYARGVADAGMGMSMAYERHDGYDSLFEPFFARGYDDGWRQTR